MFIPGTSYQEYLRVCREMSVLVLEPEVRVCSVVSSRSSSLFCTMTSVYSQLFSLPYIHLLSISSVSPPPPSSSRSLCIYSFPFVFVSLPSCHHSSIIPAAECRVGLAKLNHFHREYIRHVQNLPDDRERFLCYTPRTSIIAYLFFTLTYIALQEYSYPITPIFSSPSPSTSPLSSTTGIPTTVLIIHPSH